MIIFFNANIITLDKTKANASAMVVEGKQIIAIGDSKTLLQQVPPSCRKIDIANRTILPGFTDSHIHTLQYAQSLIQIDCETNTKQECLSRIREFTHRTTPGKWILGHGWNQNQWVDGYGNRFDLDKISSTHPIYLTSKSLHASWANSLALELAGIGVDTSDPPGGVIQRNEHGDPTGILLENSIPLLEKHIPPPSEFEVLALLTDVQKMLFRFGITCVHDFDKENCLHAFQKLDAARQLKLRVIKSIPLEYLDRAISAGLHTGDRIINMEFGALKLFADGALGSRTAALFAPYESEPHNNGLLIRTHCELVELGRKAAENGISLAIHAIGDRALNIVLQVYAELFDINPVYARLRHKHRIEHVQLVLPDDLYTFSRLGLVASMQPSHAPSDREMAFRYWGNRTENSYPLRSVQNAGILSIYGSDAPVENPNPFFGIAAAVSRQAQGQSEPFHIEQSIELQKALEGFCTNPYIATGHNHDLGILKKGYNADFIIIQSNPFAFEPIDLYNNVVEEVYISGLKVFTR